MFQVIRSMNICIRTAVLLVHKLIPETYWIQSRQFSKVYFLRSTESRSFLLFSFLKLISFKMIIHLNNFPLVDVHWQTSFSKLQELWQNFLLCKPRNGVCEGYVFTGVCLSTGGSPWQRPPPRTEDGNKRVIHILLECILVLLFFYRRPTEWPRQCFQ